MVKTNYNGEVREWSSADAAIDHFTKQLETEEPDTDNGNKCAVIIAKLQCGETFATDDVNDTMPPLPETRQRPTRGK